MVVDQVTTESIRHRINVRTTHDIEYRAQHRIQLQIKLRNKRAMTGNQLSHRCYSGFQSIQSRWGFGDIKVYVHCTFEHHHNNALTKHTTSVVTNSAAVMRRQDSNCSSSCFSRDCCSSYDHGKQNAKYVVAFFTSRNRWVKLR